MQEVHKRKDLSHKPRKNVHIYKTLELEFTLIELIIIKTFNVISRSSRPEVFLGKDVLKICSKFTGELWCRSGVSIQLLCNFIEIALWHGCSSVNLLHILRTSFLKKTSERLLLNIGTIRVNTDFWFHNSHNFSLFPQFVIASSIFLNLPSGRKLNIYEWDWTNFDQQMVIIVYLAQDWNNLIKNGTRKRKSYFSCFLRRINFNLNKYAALKKVFNKT